MLFGEYDHQIDAKNRIRIPSRFKQEIGEEYVFMKGVNKCVSVYPKSVFESRYGNFANVSLFDLEAQQALLEVFSSCFNAQEDGQGRVVLPEKLREYANLQKDVVSIGVGDHVDIYDKEEREKMRQGKSYSEIVSTLIGKIN